MIDSKKCFKCELVKLVTEFYKHPDMLDGYLNKCKTCAKSDATEHRLKNIEKVREYDRERGKKPHRLKKSVEQSRSWRGKDSRRNKAHQAVARAISKGTLEKQPCCRCQNPKSLAHHEDYDFPLDVTWLCQPCHKQRHKEMLEQ